MHLVLTSGNWLADALPSGAYAVINDRDSTIATHLGVLDPGERILYPRITSFPVFKVAGQTHADPPRVKEFVEGSGWTDRTEFHPSGTSPVIYDLLGQLVVAQPHTGNGSQGYRYVAPDGRLVTGDATYGPFRKGSIDLFGWTSLSGWLVGQGPEVGCWAYRDGHGFTNLAEAAAALQPNLGVADAWRRNLWQFVRFSVEDGRFALAAWVMHAPSVLLSGTLEELAALPTVPRLPSVTPPAPAPSPTPDPTPEPVPEVPMSIPAQEIVDVVTEAKAEVEALGYRFKTVEEAMRDNYAHYTFADKQQAFLVTMRAAWKLAQRYPDAGIGLERYEGASGTPSPFAEDGPSRYSGDIILLGKSGPSCDILIAGVQPAAQVDQTTDPQAPANWARDWAPPINPYRGATAPTPTPEPAPTPVPTMPDSLLADLQAERAKYPAKLEREEQAAEILNAVAWKHRGDGWGLSAKPNGNNVLSEQHDVLVAYDILHHKPTDTLWDVATGEWENMTIQWAHQPVHHHDPDRPWLAPVQPVTETPAPEPLPEPPPLPTPGNSGETPTLACKCDMAAILAEFKEIKAALARIEKPVNVETQFPLYEGTLNLGWLGTKQLTLRPKAQE